MPSNHLILCHPLLLPPSILPSIRVFSNESVLHWVQTKTSERHCLPLPGWGGLRTGDAQPACTWSPGETSGESSLEWVQMDTRVQKTAVPATQNLQTINAGEGEAEREPSSTLGGSVNWYSHYAEHSGVSLKWSEVNVTQLCLTLCDPLCTVHGILQARILEWVAVPFSVGSSQPRDRTPVSHIAGRLFTSWATREALEVP